MESFSPSCNDRLINAVSGIMIDESNENETSLHLFIDELVVEVHIKESSIAAI